MILFFAIFFSLNAYSSYMPVIKENFHKSEKFKLFKLKTQEINMGKSAQISWLPLQLQAAIYHTTPIYGNEAETIQTGGSILKYSDTLSSSLIFNDFSSFKNTFKVDYERTVFDQDYSTLNRGRNYDFSNKIEYNIANGGNNSDLKINQQISLNNLSLSELNYLKDINSDFLDFSQKMLSYLLLDCKLKTQNQLKALVDETLKKGKALLDINSISKKDYLNYENMQIDLERTLANLGNDLLQSQYFLESTGYKLDKNLDKKQFLQICQLSNLKDQDIFSSRDVSASLDLEILKKQIDLNSWQLKEARRNTVSDVVPFIELGANSNIDQETKDYRVVVGLNLGWDVLNNRQRQQVKYRNLSKQYNIGDYQLTKKKLEFDFLSLRQDLKNIDQLIDIAKRNLKSNEELLRILKLEHSIKKGDSLNFATSVSNRANLTNNFFDLVQQREVKIIQIELLLNGKILLD